MNVGILKFLVWSLFLPVITFSSCKEEGVNATKEAELRPLTTDEKEVIASSNEFAFNLYRSMHASSEDENLFISPLSIGMALAMTYNGAAGTTKEEIKNTLGFKDLDDNQLNVAYAGLKEVLLNADKKVDISIANAIWYRNGFVPTPAFKYAVTNYYNAGISPLDMDSPSAKEEINNWVENKTNGKITDLIKEIRREHIMFLVNAVYFKGIWTTKFDKSKTKRENFIKEDGSMVLCDMMHSEKMLFKYYRDQTKQLIDLPYGNKNFSMTIILPAENVKVDDIAAEFNATTFKTWLASANNTENMIGLPKFKIEYEENLNEILQSLGIKQAFEDDANFSELIEGVGGLKISEVLHKTYVDVNEEGTEAAAATSVGISVTSMPLEVTINKPFIFLIRENHSGAILFAGKLMQP